MKNVTLALALGTAVTTTVIGLSTNPAQALTFQFNGVTSDGDSFSLTMTTEDTLQSQSYPAFTTPSGLASPAYTFTGYLITSLSGTFDNNPIVSLLSSGSGVFNPLPGNLPTPGVGSGTFYPGEYPEGSGLFPDDLIPHSPTDNLYNPNGGFASGVLPSGNQAGEFSFGGIAFLAQEETETEAYQLFTRSDFGSTFNRPGDYGGCPGSCVGVTKTPEPSYLLSFLALGTLGATATFKRKLKR